MGICHSLTIFREYYTIVNIMSYMYIIINHIQTAFNSFFIFFKKQYSLNCASRADCQEMCYGHVCGAGFHKVHVLEIIMLYDKQNLKLECRFLYKQHLLVKIILSERAKFATYHAAMFFF